MRILSDIFGAQGLVVGLAERTQNEGLTNPPKGVFRGNPCNVTTLTSKNRKTFREINFEVV